MLELFNTPQSTKENSGNPPVHEFTTTPEERITLLKADYQEIERKIQTGELSAEAGGLRLRIITDILKDTYDTYYVGSPVYRQKQLSIFEEDVDLQPVYDTIINPFTFNDPGL